MAVLAGLLGAVVARLARSPGALRWGAVVGLSWASHVLLDWLGRDGGALLGFRNITVSIWNSYTVFGSNPTQHMRISRHWGPNYLRMRYVSSTKGFYCGYSGDGLSWIETTVQTLFSHPTTSMGFYSQRVTTSLGEAVVWWYRVRSDSTGTTSPYPASD